MGSWDQHPFWLQDPVVLGWIQKCCEAAAAPGNEGQRLSWRAAKQQLWPASKENEFAALRISQFSDDIAALPEEELQARHESEYLQPCWVLKTGPHATMSDGKKMPSPSGLVKKKSNHRFAMEQIGCCCCWKKPNFAAVSDVTGVLRGSRLSMNTCTT